MNAQNKAPCAAWAEKLALLHPDDLSPAERAAQEAHVASCPACSSVSTQYAEIAALLRDLPAGDVPEEVPPRLVGLWEEEDKRQQARSPLPISTQQARPKRNRRARLVAALAAVLVAAVVLGSTITHLVSVQPGKQVNPGGPGSSSGGAAIIFGRFFTIHQSVIYVTSGSGKVLALRSDNGALIRSYTIGDGRALEPPVIVGNILYESDLNTLYALRVSDGSVVWHIAFGDHLAISSPSLADGIVYITTSAVDHQIYALRASNGAVLWHYQTRGVNEEVGVLAVANGIAYIGSSDGNVQHIYALNAKNGALLWSRQFSERTGPGLLVNDGVIFAFAGNAIFALQADSGTLLWTHRVENTISLEASSIADGFLYTLGDNGYVYALRIEDGKLKWSSKIAEHALSASPLILMNGMIFVASFGGFNLAGNNPKTAGGNLYALRADNGRIIWQKNFGRNDIPIMAVDHGIIYVTSLVPPNDTLYALRPGDGSTLWSKSLNDTFSPK
jgi:outer membrane protein assembly factor BamB